METVIIGRSAGQRQTGFVRDFSRPYGTWPQVATFPATEVAGYFHSPLRGWIIDASEALP
jgi:hypothetical protein